MGTRMEIVRLRRDLINNGVNIKDIRRGISNYLTAINCAKTLMDSPNLTIPYLSKAKGLLRNLVFKVTAKLNPSTNQYIFKEEHEKGLFVTFDSSVGIILEKLDTKERETIAKIDTSGRRTKPIQRILMESFASEMASIFDDLVVNALKESYLKFCDVENPQIIRIVGEEKKKEDIEKDEDLYWYLVFSYFFDSSKKMREMLTKQDGMVRPSDIVSGVTRGIERALRPKQTKESETVEEQSSTELGEIFDMENQNES